MHMVIPVEHPLRIVDFWIPEIIYSVNNTNWWRTTSELVSEQ